MHLRKSSSDAFEEQPGFIGISLRGQFCKVCGLADEESARMVEDYREYYRDKGILEIMHI